MNERIDEFKEAAMAVDIKAGLAAVSLSIPALMAGHPRTKEIAHEIGKVACAMLVQSETGATFTSEQYQTMLIAQGIALKSVLNKLGSPVLIRCWDMDEIMDAIFNGGG